jgi:hypothetical protein
MTDAGSSFAGRVVEFLVPPRELTKPFLWIMGTVFAAGLVCALVGGYRFSRQLARARDEYEKDERARQLESPVAWLRSRANPDAILRWLDPIPSVLITLGILGTFLGLGIAVACAIPALNKESTDDQVREALGELLRVVSFKFQTSAWGIILSLAFTIFVRIPAGAEMERRLESAAASLASLRMGLTDAISSAFGELRTALVHQVEALGVGSTALATESQHLGTQVSSLGEAVTKSAVALAAGAKDLQGVGTRIDGSLSQIHDTLAREIGDSNRKFLAAVEEQARSVERSLNGTKQTLEGAIERQGKSTLETQTKVHEALSGLNATVSRLSLDITHSLEDVRRYQAQSTVSFQLISETLEKFRRQEERLLVVLETFQRVASERNLAEAARGLAGSSPRGEASHTNRQLGAKPNDGIL